MPLTHIALVYGYWHNFFFVLFLLLLARTLFARFICGSGNHDIRKDAADVDARFNLMGLVAAYFIIDDVAIFLYHENYIFGKLGWTSSSTRVIVSLVITAAIYVIGGWLGNAWFEANQRRKMGPPHFVPPKVKNRDFIDF